MNLYGYKVVELHKIQTSPDAPKIVRIRSAYIQGFSWVRGENEASHMPEYGIRDIHKAPYPFCRCGINAYWSALQCAKMFNSEHYVLVEIRGWGEVDLYRKGWRSQYAEITAICSTRDKETDDILRNTYDCPIVANTEAMQSRREHLVCEYKDAVAFIPKVSKLKKRGMIRASWHEFRRKYSLPRTIIVWTVLSTILGLGVGLAMTTNGQTDKLTMQHRIIAMCIGCVCSTFLLARSLIQNIRPGV